MFVIFQMESCHRLYSKLGLHSETHTKEHTDDDVFPDIFPNSQITGISPIFFSRSAPGTAGYTSPTTQTTRHAWVTPPRLRSVTDKKQNEEIQSNAKSRSSKLSSAVTFVENGERKRRRIDPMTLREHLLQNGYGLPVSLDPPPKYKTRRFPSGFRHKLPEDPSKREKIKGRARLDYEMANMRAMAFCEQQTFGKVLRTASANMRNRDVQFVDDEMRAQVQARDMMEDDSDSIVYMEMTRDELEEKINTWIDDVDLACNNVRSLDIT